MKNEIREMIERLKVKAELFLHNDIRAFVLDINDTYYFCDIVFVGEVYLVVQDFEGERAGTKTKLYWSDVVKIEEYKKKGVTNEAKN
jgi:hypothetical protein